MGLGPLGIWEILVIVGVALLIFGPAKLPEIARGVGKAVKSFRDVKDEVTGVVLDESPRATRKPAEPSRSELDHDSGEDDTAANEAPANDAPANDTPASKAPAKEATEAGGDRTP